MIIWSDDFKRKILKLKREAENKAKAATRDSDYELYVHWTVRAEGYQDVMELLNG